MDDHAIRDLLARGMRILAHEVGTDNRGHVSYRPPGEDRVYIVGRLHVLGRTMSSTTYDDIVVIDLDGKLIEGRFPAPDESVMHTAVYRRREDVRSVVHVHPPKCVVFSIAGVPLVPVSQSMIAPFADGPIRQFEQSALINTPRLGEEVAELLGSSRAVQLQGHGVLTVGNSIDDAVVTTLLLEESARAQYEAALLGNVRALDLSSPLLEANREMLRSSRWAWQVWAFHEEQLKLGRRPGGA